MDKSLGGTDDEGNLRALCSTCNQGAKNITQEPPSYLAVMTHVRRAKETDQRAVFDWLRRKFEPRLGRA